MATTRLIVHHISKGETIAQSLADRFDYGQNPDKTQQGELISAYMCDPETADAEFLISKAKYKAITGREQKKDADILCYQIRQAFVPGEITPEEANRIGYETAMRYKEYRRAKKDMQELITAKANIDHLLGLTDAQKNKEMER